MGKSRMAVLTSRILGLLGPGQSADFPPEAASVPIPRVDTVNPAVDSPAPEALSDKLRDLERSQRQLLAYAQDLNKAYRELQSTYLSTLEALAAAIDARDTYTYGHSRQVRDYAQIIGSQYGLAPRDLEVLSRAALLHDIGKIGVPDATLGKPGKLSVDEWKQVRRHPTLGHEMLSRLRFLADALPAIRHHQERYDGTGYPDGLRSEEIPLLARVLAVADAFDAMTSERPYRPPLSPEQARDEIVRCQGTQFDPQIVAAFLLAFDRLATLLEPDQQRQAQS